MTPNGWDQDDDGKYCNEDTVTWVLVPHVRNPCSFSLYLSSSVSASLLYLPLSVYFLFSSSDHSSVLVLISISEHFSPCLSCVYNRLLVAFLFFSFCLPVSVSPSVSLSLSPCLSVCLSVSLYLSLSLCLCSLSFLPSFYILV